MKSVSFLTAEAGKDLIISFAIESGADAMQVESLTLLRTPVYEGFLPVEDRGVHVSPIMTTKMITCRRRASSKGVYCSRRAGEVSSST